MSKQKGYYPATSLWLTKCDLGVWRSLDSAFDWGSKGRWFKSSHPDFNFYRRETDRGRENPPVSDDLRPPCFLPCFLPCWPDRPVWQTFCLADRPTQRGRRPEFPA